ncbi:MAG: DUF1131 family protein [Cyanobacteria bacterium P01_F01_bin.53]
MNSTQPFLSAIAKPLQLSLLVVLLLSTACTPKTTVSTTEALEPSTAETASEETASEETANEEISSEETASEETASEETASEEGESPSVSEPESEPDAESEASEVTITFSDTAVGGINAETRFDIATIQALFPELVVTESVKSEEGIDYPIIVVSDGGQNVLTIDSSVDGSLVRTVLIESTQVSNASGDSIGDIFSDIFEEDISRNCFVGTDGVGANHVICPAAATRNVSYFFEGDWSQQGLTEIPLIEELNSAPLKKILWIARNS